MNKKHPEILLLGNPLLRKVSETVQEFGGKLLLAEAESMHGVLLRFREEHGFGRGIAAPQLGILKRMVALNLNGKQTTMINPEIIWSSPEEFTLWDDCMSFPDLLVRVKRNTSVTVKFQDETGAALTWEKLDSSTSELMQHEIDHLNGVLAVDRAIDRNAISYRVNVESADRQK